MQDVATHIQSDPRVDVAQLESSMQQMQHVLSRGLPSFYRRAYRLLGNTADAEDAVQDALLAAYKHLHQFRGQSQMSTWLHTIVANCARMQLRKRSRYARCPLIRGSGRNRNIPYRKQYRTRGPIPKSSATILR